MTPYQRGCGIYDPPIGGALDSTTPPHLLVAPW